MKNISMLLFFVILLVSCSPQISSEHEVIPTLPTSTSIPTSTRTPRPTRTPTATLIPCPTSGMLTVGDIQIFFHEADITPADCKFFATYVEKVNEWATINGFLTKNAQVHVFTTPAVVTDFEYEWAQKAGCNPESKEIILQSWKSGGAHASLGSAFFMITGWWDKNHNSENIVALVHELTHVIQGNYAGSCQRMWQIPDWYKEGQAQYFGRLLSSEWGVEPADVRENLLGCNYKLSQLVSGQDCIYMQGEQAFILLREKHGERSMDVFMEIAKGKSFNTAFYDVYKINVSAYSDEFDAYHLNGYKLPPVPTSTP